MTKTESKDLGIKLGNECADKLNDDSLRKETADMRAILLANANASAPDYFRSINGNSVLFVDSFVSAGMLRYNARRNELPDIKEAARLQIFVWTLDSMEKGAKGDLDEFNKRYTEDPAYAFEWGERAFKAAAEVLIVKHVRAMQVEGASLDTIMAELTDAALRGAEYGNHSTSMTSNLMAEYKTAAYAKLARKL